MLKVLGLQFTIGSHAMSSPATIPDAQQPAITNDAFISYSRKDEQFAAALEKALKAYKPPKDLNLPQRYLAVFRDKEDFTGVEYHQSLEKHLKGSGKMILICSPDACKSTYVNEEIEHFAHLHGAENIIPVLLAGIPNNEAKAGQEEETCFPPALTKALEMPLAVNYKGFRPEKDKISKAVFYGSWYTLLANLYGLSRTEIEQRDKKRATRRRVIAVGGTTAFVAALTVALVVTYISRQEAVREKGIANEQEGIAKQRQADAERARQGEEIQRENAQASAKEARRQRDEATRQRDKAEADGFAVTALRHFETGRQMQALLAAIQAGRKLEPLISSDTAISNYPVGSPALALQLILDNMYEENEKDDQKEPLSPRGVGTTVSDTCNIEDNDGERWQLDQIPDDKLRALMGHQGRIGARGCTPDAKHLVTASVDGTVRLLHLSGREPAQLIGRQGGITHINFNEDSQHFSTTNVWRSVIYWDLSRKNRANHTIPLTAHQATVTAICFSRNGKLLATAGNDKAIRFWSVTGAQIRQPVSTGAESVIGLFLSQDGNCIISVGAGGTIQQWDWAGHPAKILRLGDSVPMIHASISQDGLVALAQAGGSVLVRDLTGQMVMHLPGEQAGGHRGWVMGVSFSPDGKILATGGADDTVKLWNSPWKRPFTAIRVDQGGVMTLAFSPDGRLLTTGGDNGTVKVWTLAGQLLMQLAGHEGKVVSVSFGDHGKLLVSAGVDGTVRIWRLPAGEQVAQFAGHIGAMAGEASGGDFGAAGLSFAPDGLHIAIAENGGTVRLWRIEKLGELLRKACVWAQPYLSSHSSVPRLCP